MQGATGLTGAMYPGRPVREGVEQTPYNVGGRFMPFISFQILHTVLDGRVTGDREF